MAIKNSILSDWLEVVAIVCQQSNFKRNF